jgi:DNA polymerase-3 subunit epsilon
MGRVKRLISGHSYDRIAHEGNPEGVLFGEVLVFMGSLALPRREMVTLAVRAGCEVANSVTKHTMLLVVGDADVRKLHGQKQGSMDCKAQDWIA